MSAVAPAGPQRVAARLLAATDVSSLPRMLPPPAMRGVIRAAPADFIVTERLPFEPAGTGEHLYLRLRKSGQNTRWIARQLADACGVRPRDVSFAGLKDRHAVAEQWFSVYLPGREAPSIDIEAVQIVQATRHRHKLRTGMLAGNSFQIRVSGLKGDGDDLAQRIAGIRARGVPNYFGPQRFGRGGSNLALVYGPMPPGSAARRFGPSALRSALFNAFLGARVEDGSWERLLPGEISWCADTRSFESLPEGPDAAGEVAVLSRHPTGLLWGAGDNAAGAEAAARESAFAARYRDEVTILASLGVRMMRRPLRVAVQGLALRRDGDALDVSFALPRGAFATSVLRELVSFEDAQAVGCA